MGLSLAKCGEIALKNGCVEQSNFDDYQVVRIDEAPTETRTHIVEQGLEVASSGVGEPRCAADRQSAGVTQASRFAKQWPAKRPEPGDAELRRRACDILLQRARPAPRDGHPG